jgi:enoyl-CoA hydratase
MADSTDTKETGIARRDFLVAGAGMTLASLGGSATALAQAAATGAAAPSGAAKIVVERLPGGVLLVGINRPEVQNRFDADTLIGLGKAYYQLDHDDELRVAVLHGVGPNFCVGLDVPAFLAAQKAGRLPPKDADFLNPAGLTPPFRTKPVVIAVQGGTKTLGHELFLSADVRVAASDTVFAQNETFFGVFPAGGATVRFPREAGWGNAMRYILTGEEWGADEAYRMGLAQAVTPPGKQLDRAVELAKKIASAAPLGVRATLASARQALTGEDAALAAVQPEATRIRQSADYQEFQRAQQEKRPPVYHGR